MKTKFTLAVFFLVTGLGALAAGKDAARPALPQADSVVWVGLDYSLVRLYGTMDFNDADEIFPRMLDAWNALFLQEQLDDVRKMLGKNVTTDTAGMSDRNRLAKKDQIIRQDGDLVGQTHLADPDLAAAVRAYKLSTKSGLGLVFIVDRLCKSQQRGAVWIVFFDLGSRQIVAKERVVGRAAGFGFRNYWFRVPKDAVKELKKFK